MQAKNNVKLIAAVSSAAKAGKSDAVIAQELGLEKEAVRSLRRRNGIVSLMAAKYKRRNIDWQNVDWSKTNTELAKELGLHVKNVGAYRRRFLAPKPSKKTPKNVSVSITLPENVVLFLQSQAPKLSDAVKDVVMSSPDFLQWKKSQ